MLATIYAVAEMRKASNARTTVGTESRTVQEPGQKPSTRGKKQSEAGKKMQAVGHSAVKFLLKVLDLYTEIWFPAANQAYLYPIRLLLADRGLCASP